MDDNNILFPFYRPPSDVALIHLDPRVLDFNLDFSRVLFIDFDGVLHPEDHTPETEFCFVKNFADAVRLVDLDRQLPIVISSTWRHHTTFDEIRSKFPSYLMDQVVGVTPYLRREQLAQISDWDAIGGEESKSRHRQREIMQWLNAHSPGSKWLAIDDRPEYFHRQCEHLFIVPKASSGLTTEVTYDLIARLRKFLFESERFVRIHRVC
jgi:hypothetical protein